MNYSNLVYNQAGITRPTQDPQHLRNRAHLYNLLATTCTSTGTTVDAIIADVEKHNSGKARDQFSRVIRDNNSLHTRLSSFAAAAALTAERFELAAADLETGVAEMDAFTINVHATLMANPILTSQILQQSRVQLATMEQKLAQKLAANMAFELPHKVEYHPESEAIDNRGGILDQQTIQRWRDSNLTLEQRRKVLQKIVDQEAAKRGIEPPPEVAIDDEATKVGAAALYTHNDRKIHITPDSASDGSIFGTVGHELGHAEMFKLYDDYKKLSFIDIMVIKSGARPDPFRKNGYTIDDISYMAEANANYDYTAQSYPFHPDEVAAEQTRAEVANAVTDKQINHLIDEATR